MGNIFAFCIITNYILYFVLCSLNHISIFEYFRICKFIGLYVTKLEKLKTRKFRINFIRNFIR